MEQSSDPRRDDGDRTNAEAIDDQTKIYEQAFNLSPETSRLAAEDSVAGNDGKPASDDVDEARAARARALEDAR